MLTWQALGAAIPCAFTAHCHCLPSIAVQLPRTETCLHWVLPHHTPCLCLGINGWQFCWVPAEAEPSSAHSVLGVYVQPAVMSIRSQADCLPERGIGPAHQVVTGSVGIARPGGKACQGRPEWTLWPILGHAHLHPSGKVHKGWCRRQRLYTETAAVMAAGEQLISPEVAPDQSLWHPPGRTVCLSSTGRWRQQAWQCSAAPNLWCCQPQAQLLSSQ